VSDVQVDLSSGLPTESEEVLTARPDVPAWTENLLFAPYDPTADVGLWMHLGTMAWEWETWEDRVLVALPGDEGALSMWAYHRTDPARRPGGANLRFECLEPFRRWRVTFDGMAVRTPYEEMRTRRVSDGEKERLHVELETEATTPVWDAGTAAGAHTGQGSMDSQEWAKEHYEQLYVARGTVAWGDREVAFDGAGWRDHSRGPRGGAMASWGGHVIAGCVFRESRRAFGLSRYWDRDKTVTLEGGYIVQDGRLEHARVVEVPLFDELRHDGERLPFVLQAGERTLEVEAVTTTGLWTGFSKDMPYGAIDIGSTYALNWGTCDWQGEQGVLYIERSDLSAPMQ
jgi:hypothetical protein